MAEKDVIPCRRFRTFSVSAELPYITCLKEMNSVGYVWRVANTVFRKRALMNGLIKIRKNGQKNIRV